MTVQTIHHFFYSSTIRLIKKTIIKTITTAVGLCQQELLEDLRHASQESTINKTSAYDKDTNNHRRFTACFTSTIN